MRFRGQRCSLLFTSAMRSSFRVGVPVIIPARRRRRIDTRGQHRDDDAAASVVAAAVCCRSRGTPNSPTVGARRESSLFLVHTRTGDALAGRVANTRALYRHVVTANLSLVRAAHHRRTPCPPLPRHRVRSSIRTLFVVGRSWCSQRARKSSSSAALPTDLVFPGPFPANIHARALRPRSA